MRVLERSGFQFKRHGKGSHDIYSRSGHRFCPSVPMGHKDIAIGTAQNILVHQAGLTMSEAERLK